MPRLRVRRFPLRIDVTASPKTGPSRREAAHDISGSSCTYSASRPGAHTLMTPVCLSRGGAGGFRFRLARVVRSSLPRQGCRLRSPTTDAAPLLRCTKQGSPRCCRTVRTYGFAYDFTKHAREAKDGKRQLLFRTVPPTTVRASPPHRHLPACLAAGLDHPSGA